MPLQDILPLMTLLVILLVMKIVAIAALIVSLGVGMVFNQNVFADQQKILNVSVYLNGAAVNGATCYVNTDVGYMPVSGITRNGGKITFSLPSSATSASISCNLNGHNGSDTTQLSDGVVTNVKVTLQ